MELPKLAGINNQAIDLMESKQTLYGPIYSLGPVELETLKTYIKIWPMDLSGLSSHRLEIRSCSFLRKDRNLWFRCSLSMIGEFLDCLGRVKYYTQPDLTDKYHGKKTCERQQFKDSFPDP